MANRHYVFIGPYAEWLPPEPEHFIREGEEDPGWGDLIEGTTLHWNISYLTALPPTVEREGKQLYQYCCMPRATRAGQPRERMFFLFDDECERSYIADWIGVDPRKEIAWFEQAFAEELHRLVGLMGGRPSFHWGLVYMQT